MLFASLTTGESRRSKQINSFAGNIFSEVRAKVWLIDQPKLVSA